MKNSAADERRLNEVRAAMAEGLIGREPSVVSKRFSKAEALRLHRVLVEKQREETLRKMVEDTPDNYWLITDESQLKQLVEELSCEKEVAVDTETTGVDVYTDEVVGMSITLPKADKHVYIPFSHKEGEQLDRMYVFDELNDFLYDDSIGKVLHNAIFDIAMFRRHGYDLKG